MHCANLSPFHVVIMCSLGGSLIVHANKYRSIMTMIGLIQCSKCFSVSLILWADFTRYVRYTRHSFMYRAVYVMQNPRCRVHLTAMQEGIVSFGNRATI